MYLYVQAGGVRQCVECSVGEEGERKTAVDAEGASRVEEKKEKKLRPHIPDSPTVGETEAVRKKSKVSH